MPTDTGRRPTDAGRFLLGAAAWSVGLFGLLRLYWTETHILLPITRVQAGMATGLFGPPAVPVQATLACSSADALALCLGAVLAYPVNWRRRAAAAFGGTMLILSLNTLRIGTLGRVGASPALFNTLQVYVWPAVLTLAIAAYVFAWMRVEDRRQPTNEAATMPRPARRFVVLAAALLLLFVAASPLYLESAILAALSGFIARAAAAVLSISGISAHAAGSVLWTSSGGFLVTPECISTPLIPVYLAAVSTYSTTRRWCLLGIVATVPLFICLGIVRLLVVALPGVAGSSYFLVHAFNQLLAGAVVVLVAAVWRHGGPASLGPALGGIAVGCLFVQLAGPLYTRVVTATAVTGWTAGVAGMSIDDPQGALALLPAFQIGLYLAIWVAAFITVAWRRVLAGLVVVGLSQAAGLIALNILAAHVGLIAHVREIRGWAVAGPVLIFAMAVNRDRSRR